MMRPRKPFTLVKTLDDREFVIEFQWVDWGVERGHSSWGVEATYWPIELTEHLSDDDDLVQKHLRRWEAEVEDDFAERKAMYDNPD
jgi:hypothetical protein